MAASDQVRFDLLEGADIDEFIASTDSSNTKKVIKFGVTVFREFCRVTDVNFEDLSNEDLDNLLTRFYVAAKNKRGEDYSGKSMSSIRFISTRDVDIVKSGEFSRSNRAFKAKISKLKSIGKAEVKHYPPINDDDLNKIDEHLDLAEPKGLQRKAFMACMLQFANRGMENLRNMRKSDLILHNENSESEYFTLIDKSTKNHGSDTRKSQGGEMHACSDGHGTCPVKTIKEYLSKLHPECPFLWQRPKQKPIPGRKEWYDNSPIGTHTLEAMMKTISKEANLSQIYTNHSLRATCITRLDHAGFTSRDIMTVSGHRSENSIKHYSRTSDENKIAMSKAISARASTSSTEFDARSRDSPSTSHGANNNINTNSNTNMIEVDEPTTSDSVNAGNMSGEAADASVLDDVDLTLSDSQLERVMSSIPSSPSAPLENITNQNLTLVQKTTRPQFHFHSGCVVHIYNK